MGKDPQSFLLLKTFIEYDIIHSFKTSRLGGLIRFFLSYCLRISFITALQYSRSTMPYWSIKELWKFWNSFWVHSLTTLIKLLLNLNINFLKKKYFSMQKGWFKTFFFWYISDFWNGIDCKHYFKDILTRRVSTTIHIGVCGSRCAVLKQNAIRGITN